MLCGVVVEWIVWIWFDEQEDQTEDHRVYSQHWLPIFSQNIQANISFKVNIRMVNWSQKLAFWWGERIIIWNVNGKNILSSLPNALILLREVYKKLKGHNAFIIELNWCMTWDFELLNFLLKSDLSRWLPDLLFCLCTFFTFALFLHSLLFLLNSFVLLIFLDSNHFCNSL